MLYFRGTRQEAWEDIYKIYAPALGGPGLPDRSWILRWGWDLTLGKLPSGDSLAKGVTTRDSGAISRILKAVSEPAGAKKTNR